MTVYIEFMELGDQGKPIIPLRMQMVDILKSRKPKSLRNMCKIGVTYANLDLWYNLFRIVMRPDSSQSNL